MAMTRTPAEAYSVKVAVAIIILVVVVLNAGGFIVYSTAERYLDIEWGKRLESLASVIALDAARQMGGDEGEDLESLRPWLEEIRESTLLRSTFILTSPESQGFVGVGINGDQVAILYDIDFVEISGAWDGATTDTEFYELDGSFYKRAYSPVFDNVTGEPIMVVGVEADAGFFMVLVGIKRTLVAVAILSFCLCFLFVPVVFRMTKSFVHLEEALSRSEKALELDQLAAGLAHEIRNPLGIIQANAEVLLEACPDKDQVEMLHDILEETERLDSLVSGVLGRLAESESREEVFDLREALAQAGDHFRRSLDDPTIHLKTDFPFEEKALPVQGDRARFEGALWNLLRNSRESMPNGGVITIGMEVLESGYRVSVRDTGTGISRWSLRKILLPFYSEKEKGTGLGLPTVQRIVHDMGGTFSIKSVRGKGTEVAIHLPKITRDGSV